MPNVSVNGVSYRFTKSAWCRHNEALYCTYAAGTTLAVRTTCSNCGRYAEGSNRQLARDALMKIEAVGTTTEVTTAP